MAKKTKPKPDPKAKPPDDNEVEERDPIERVAETVAALRRGQRRFNAALIVLLLLVGGALMTQLLRSRGDFSGFVDRFEHITGRIDDNLARVQDQSATTRAGMDVLRGDIAQMKRQLDQLARAQFAAPATAPPDR